MSPVQLPRNYNQRPLKELCAKVIKHNYISNVKLVFDSEFFEKLSPSELSYLTHPGEEQEEMLSIVLYTLSLCSSTFTPMSSKLLGRYTGHGPWSHAPAREGRGARVKPPLPPI